MLCLIFKLLCTLPLFKVSLCLVSFMQSVVFAECHILLLCYHIFYCNAQCRTTYCVSQFFNCHAHCRHSKCRCVWCYGALTDISFGFRYQMTVSKTSSTCLSTATTSPSASSGQEVSTFCPPCPPTASTTTTTTT